MSNRKPRLKLLATFGFGVAVTAAAMFAVRARAAGVPDARALTYTGYLEDGDGNPLTTELSSVGIELWDAEVDGTRVCDTSVENFTPQSGRFQLELPETCVNAVKASPDLWADVQVEGASLGRTKLGAVPYAIEAGHAAEASAAAGALDARIGDIEAASPGDSGFRAISSAGATIPHGSPRTFSIWDTEVFDLADEFDPATDTFTSTDGGYYEVSCTLFYVTVAGSYFIETGIIAKGVLADADNMLNVGATYQPVRANTLLRLDPGDELRCGAWQNSGGSLTLRAHSSFPSEAPASFTAVRIKPL